MAAKVKFAIKQDSLTPRMKMYQKKFPDVWKRAVIKGGLQLLNWSINGSPDESVRPPVKFGVLRGSGSVFFGNELVGVSPKVNGKGDPATSHRGKSGSLTVGFNTDYAAKLHDYPFVPGPVSAQSGDVAYKWLERHMKADKDQMMKFIGILIEKAQDDL